MQRLAQQQRRVAEAQVAEAAAAQQAAAQAQAQQALAAQQAQQVKRFNGFDFFPDSFIVAEVPLA